MIMCGEDSDVHRWGLCQIMGDWSMPQYYETARQNDIGGCDGRYYRESNDYSVHTAVENDEVIAHALQEEYSVIAMAEASGRLDAGNEQLQASVLAQDWHGSTARNAWSGNEGSPREEDDSGACSSSFREDSYEGERVQLDQIDDNASLDDEVDKRLNYMVSIPHIPKINGEIPNVDEATSDHQRLLDRLQLYDLVERKVAGDGNCQFRALSDQLYRTPDHHDFVRKQIVNQLKSRPDLYEGYVPMAYDEYLKKMSESGEWGDHVTLQAAADTYGVKLFVITSFKDTCYIEILPAIQKSERVIHLSFWSEVHYNSIYPEGDPDMPTTNMTETRRKKKWWQFG